MSEQIKKAPKTLSEEVFEKLQAAIVDGDLISGQKVSESELASMFGVSRAPLREAVRRLESRGLVVKKPHVGITVASLSLPELLQIYEVREALEGMACRLAAQNMSEIQIKELRSLLDRHQVEIEEVNGQAYYQKESDFDFHYQIVKGSGNAKLASLLWGDLYHLVRMYRCRFSTTDGRPHRAFKDHNQIVDAIENRDAELAELLMRRHISSARKNIEETYRDIAV